MTEPFGPIRKTPWSILLFVVPAGVAFGGTLALMAGELGSVAAAWGNGAVQLVGLGALGLAIWGAVFLRRPIAVLTPDGITVPARGFVPWSDVSDMTQGTETHSVATQGAGTRKVVHEVVRLRRADGQILTLVMTWAAEGPQAAGDRLRQAMARSC